MYTDQLQEQGGKREGWREFERKARGNKQRIQFKGKAVVDNNTCSLPVHIFSVTCSKKLFGYKCIQCSKWESTSLSY